MSEKEKDKLMHLNEIKWLDRELVFLEKIHKTTNHEPSRKSLENTIKILKGSQDKLLNSLYVKHGIILEGADKNTEKNNDAQLKLTLPPSKSEQEKIARNLLDLKKEKDVFSQQLTNHKLSNDQTNVLENKLAEKEQEYTTKLNEIAKRPDKDVIIQIWQEAYKQDLSMKKTKEPTKTHDYSSRTH